MRLIRFDDWRTGLLVQLPEGPHLLDVVSSLGALLPSHPIASDILNGMLKDGREWASLIQHWDYVRVALRRLSLLAATRPDHPHLTMRRFDGIRIASPSIRSHRIARLELAELGEMVFDPTGRATMEQQTARTVEDYGERIASLDDVSSFECPIHDPFWWNRQG